MAKKTTLATEPPINAHEWRLFGKCHHQGNKPGMPTHLDAGITFEEQNSNLDFRPKPVRNRKRATSVANVFGKPVDGNVAVSMIKAAGAKAHKLSLDKTGSRLKETDDKSSPFLNAGNFMNYTNGKTFDKTIVLKILSQPNCEALRIYHAINDDGMPSYVLVGVDVNGFDLNFKPDKIDAMAAATDVPNNSLMSEYGYPPGSKDFDDDINPHYVLLKLAQKMNAK